MLFLFQVSFIFCSASSILEQRLSSLEFKVKTLKKLVVDYRDCTDYELFGPHVEHLESFIKIYRQFSTSAQEYSTKKHFSFYVPFVRLGLILDEVCDYILQSTQAHSECMDVLHSYNLLLSQELVIVNELLFQVVEEPGHYAQLQRSMLSLKTRSSLISIDDAVVGIIGLIAAICVGVVIAWHWGKCIKFVKGAAKNFFQGDRGRELTLIKKRLKKLREKNSFFQTQPGFLTPSKAKKKRARVARMSVRFGKVIDELACVFSDYDLKNEGSGIRVQLIKIIQSTEVVFEEIEKIIGDSHEEKELASIKTCLEEIKKIIEHALGMQEPKPGYCTYL